MDGGGVGKSRGCVFTHGTPAVAALAIAALAAAVLVVFAGTLAACGGDGAGGEPAAYTEADSGSTVTAAVGDSITIRLSENPSTGYSWQLRLSTGLSLRVDDLEQPTASPGRVGAPGTRAFTLEVTGAGTQVAEAVYQRSWESAADPGRQEFMLTVEVE
jgi:inhibitor of cysteine peptidase